MTKKRNKRILVTGAQGFLGRAVIKRLMVLGYELRLLIRSPGWIDDIDDYLMGNFEDTMLCESIAQNLEIFEGDITAPFFFFF